MIWNFIKTTTGKRLSEKVLFYDCEIARCIPDPPLDPNLDYCQGWRDFAGLGISVICAYSLWNEHYHVYLKDNLDHFQNLVNQAEMIVGFNSLAFDDLLCAANGLEVKTTYDLLCKVRIAAGMPPHYIQGVTRPGYTLEALAQCNLGYGKSGSGEQAPILWQQEKKGQVIDYCLQDVAIIHQLWKRKNHLIDPTNGQILRFN